MPFTGGAAFSCWLRTLMALPLKHPDSPEHFADLMADHQPRLRAYIRSLVLDEHVSKDILQETNVTLLKKSRDFTAGTNFTAWSFRVAYFEVLTWRRKQSRSRVHLDNALVESLAETIDSVAPDYERRLEALASCIDELPERQQTIVRRKYLNEESVQDIARDLGFRANAASQLLFRARSGLFKCITRKLAN